MLRSSSWYSINIDDMSCVFIRLHLNLDLSTPNENRYLNLTYRYATIRIQENQEVQRSTLHHHMVWCVGWSWSAKELATTSYAIGIHV